MRLTFHQLRRANVLRLPTFKNGKGEPAHSKPDGSDWSLGEWCNATLGELGEAANIIKKIHRGDVTLEEAREDLGREFADVAVYLDLLAMQVKIDLGDAIVHKFNEVSVRVGSPVRLKVVSQTDPEYGLVEAVTLDDDEMAMLTMMRKPQ